MDNIHTKRVVVLCGQDLNLSKVQEKANDIKASLRFLRGYASMREEDFVFNPEAVGAARYYFIILIEAAMNIANHFCVRLLEKAPANYAESFLLLGERGIITSKLAGNLAQKARFRNLLVHGYARVDDRRVLQIIREELGDVDEFLQQVGNIIGR